MKSLVLSKNPSGAISNRYKSMLFHMLNLDLSYHRNDLVQAKSMLRVFAEKLRFFFKFNEKF